MSQTLPKALLADSGAGPLMVELLLWSPSAVRRSAAAQGKADGSTAAAAAAAEYSQFLDEKLQQPPPKLTVLGHHSLAIHSWQAFLGRLLAATAAGNRQARPPNKLLLISLALSQLSWILGPLIHIFIRKRHASPRQDLPDMKTSWTETNVCYSD